MDEQQLNELISMVKMVNIYTRYRDATVLKQLLNRCIIFPKITISDIDRINIECRNRNRFIRYLGRAEKVNALFRNDRPEIDFPSTLRR